MDWHVRWERDLHADGVQASEGNPGKMAENEERGETITSILRGRLRRWGEMMLFIGT
jgi:hypothetical protein